MKTEWDKLVELAGSEEELNRILRLPGIKENIREELLKVGRDNLNKTIQNDKQFRTYTTTLKL